MHGIRASMKEDSVPMRRVSVLVAVLLLLAATVGAPIAQARQAAAAAPQAAGRYIVTFADDPVATYNGYKAGFPATRPKAGKNINPKSAAVVKWQKYLTAKHDAALAKVGATKYYDYTVTNNAVAAKLTARQAAKLRSTKGVISLSKDRLAKPDTSLSPSFLGLDAAGGLWSQLGGNRRAGAGVVVGVIDTGIWPESKAFAGGTGIPVPADWDGKCVAGEQFPVTSCNDKLIGARYFVAGFGKHNINKSDYLSPRDGDGHGSHTASTAAGNRVTGVSIEGKVFEDGTVSGMAPGAKVATYKVCWTGEPGDPRRLLQLRQRGRDQRRRARRRRRPELLDRWHLRVRRARPGRAGLPRRHRMPVSSSPTPPATAARAPARSTIPPRG